MVRRSVVALCILVVCLLTVSCKKIEAPTPTGPLPYEALKFPDAIPDSYGTLIGVTQNPRAPGLVGLWFQKPDRTITAVFVNVEQGKMFERVLTIPRK